MTYFRNKFDEEFLYLCNHQPKCEYKKVRLDSVSHTFWMFKEFTHSRQAKTVHVIPLLLFNRIASTNPEDKNVDNYMMICKNISDTVVVCNWSDYERGGKSDSTQNCSYWIKEINGDLEG